jgi:hypothetical protein
LPTCLHECGHMLGLIHEHQNPAGKIPWNVPVVLDYYRRTQGWDEAQTRAQVLKVYDARMLTNGGFDQNSIMLYPIPAEHLIDPSRAVGWNKAISKSDCAFVGTIYPRQGLDGHLKRLLNGPKG